MRFGGAAVFFLPGDFFLFGLDVCFDASCLEAVRAFDEHKRSQDMLNALDDVCLLLRDIKTQQIRTNEELVSLQASVWGANFLF